jgi:hypothetical protein
LEIFPFIQCHQVCGLAESGGLAKLRANSSPGSAARPFKPVARNPRHKPVKTSLLTAFTSFDVIFIICSDADMGRAQ